MGLGKAADIVQKEPQITHCRKGGDVFYGAVGEEFVQHPGQGHHGADFEIVGAAAKEVGGADKAKAHDQKA